jgi:maltooligosyltrehalose trehalohydrolase
VRVRIWAPRAARAALHLYSSDGSTVSRVVAMAPEEGGYFQASAENTSPFLYKVSLDEGDPVPDPWSRAQPMGVHGPSSLPPTEFSWSDSAWKGASLEGLVIYEVHVGTATPEGTFDALIPRLADLRELGVTAIELMPLASFSGDRNWGYDGVAPFAPSAAYGGPEGLRRLVDAAHRHRLAVIIDAVYNHFGPSGLYLSHYSPTSFTPKHQTPWGDAINYGEPVVRELALRSAEMWIADYHADGLRLDATHAIIDERQPHLLTELCHRARAAAPQRTVLVMAEDERNDSRLVSAEGHGLDAVWADDFHHQMRRAFAGDSEGYFADYTGSIADLVATLKEGWFYHGQHSHHAGKPRGTDGSRLDPSRFIHCIQNHDQVGNRPAGDRLGASVTPQAYRTMSAVLLASPYTPLLFMGQEWNASTPFIYFTHHEPELGRQVTEGRRREFAGFKGFSGDDIPDPQAESSFLRSKLDWAERERPMHRGVLALHRELLALRRQHPAMRASGRDSFTVEAIDARAFLLERAGGGKRLRVFVNLGGARQLAIEPGWRMLLSTEEERFGGRGDSAFEGPFAVVMER